MRVHRLACYAKPSHAARPALGIELHHPALDDNTARAEAASTISVPLTPMLRQRSRDLGTAAAGIEPAVRLSGSLARPTADSTRIAAGPANRDLYLCHKGSHGRADPRSTIARSPRSDPKLVDVVARHHETVWLGFNTRNGLPAMIARSRKHACAGAQAATSTEANLETAGAAPVEAKQETNVGDAAASLHEKRRRLTNPMCRQAFRPKGEANASSLYLARLPSCLPTALAHPLIDR
ncbi:hypothetical protein [Bradyrhizobium icense]|uniref:hypothetical protein n=1 Tax=Bradyrhizobium icense TaxID=1274631 RepID=UPI001F34A1F5|nr:hypothetical protein [Bradyrhizobium icense]